MNQYLWNSYLNAGGKETVRLFECFLNGEFEDDPSILREIAKLQTVFSPCGEPQWFLEALMELKENNFSFLEEGESYSVLSALEEVIAVIVGEDDLSEADILQCFLDSMVWTTSILSTELPELFVPWFYQDAFNVFERICDYFDIVLPPVPVKSDYIGRIAYYGELCEVLMDFRDENKMSPAELCAFLYDFAPKLVLSEKTLFEESGDAPRSAYFIGGFPQDGYDEKEEGKASVRFWQCNPDTQVGDAIVMYLRSPTKKIDSIWRAVTPGFIDPFFWYYRGTYIGMPVKVDGFTFEQLKQDEQTRQMPIVRKNLQGIHGVQIKPTIYNHMLDCFAENEEQKEKLPYIRYALELNADRQLHDERDVEIVLLEPLLERLGYKKEHWQRQMNIKIGRNERAIPDYVVFPVRTPGKERGEIVFEAKYSIPNNKQLEKDRRQAASYAKQLWSEYAVLVSKEGVWVYSSQSQYELCALKASWTELENDKNILNEFYHLIGNGKRTGSKK